MPSPRRGLGKQSRRIPSDGGQGVHAPFFNTLPRASCGPASLRYNPPKMLPLALQTQKRLRALAPPVVAGALAFWLYAATAAPGLTWAHDGADGGDLIAAAMIWGVPHPSGYPTYCLLGRLFALLPLGNIARRFNLFSAAAAAAGVALTCATALHLLDRASMRATWRNAAIALLAALACAAGPTLWSQGTIAEVYALNAALFALGLYWALSQDFTRRRHWAVLGLVLGLGLGNHVTLALMLPGLLLLLWPKHNLVRFWSLAGGLLLGLSVYAYLPLAAQGDPPVNWGEPRTLRGFWWVVSGQPYRGYLLGLPLRYLPQRLGAWLRLWSQQYTWLGLALALLGLWSWNAQRRRPWFWATLVMAAAHVFHALTYDTTDSYVYLIPTFLLSALWLAEGARVTLDSLAEFGHKRARALTAVGLLVLLALPLGSVRTHYAELDLSTEQTATQWAQEVLQLLPEGALLITGEDRHTFTLDYFRWVEGQRPDLIVVDGELLQQPWYVAQLTRRQPDLLAPGPEPILERLILAQLGRRPIFLASDRAALHADYVIQPRGPLWELTGRR